MLQPYSETVVAEITGTVDGGTASLVRRAVDRLSPGGLLILHVNSYGGYLAPADSIAELVSSGEIGCAAYVPPGGKAVSAAALIAIACGRIYMAPGSVIGAARPYPDDPKTVSYVSSRFRALAQRAYGDERIVEIVVRFVTEALTLTDEEAVALGIAKRAYSLDDVLRDLGAPRPSVVLSKDILDQLLSAISDPLVSSLALTLGLLLILAEIFVSGFQGYAIAGALLIAVALYGMHIIPPELLVLAMMVSGGVLVVVEFMNPGLQGFGIAGLALLALGVYMSLRGRPVPTVELPVVGAIAALGILGCLLGFVMFKAAQVVRMKRPGLREALVGTTGVAKTDVGPTTPGVVYVGGEEWSAYSLTGVVPAGSPVVVREIRGLFLYVERLPEESKGSSPGADSRDTRETARSRSGPDEPLSTASSQTRPAASAPRRQG